MSLVAVVMGSKTDEPFSKETVQVLEQLNISHEVSVISAHRTPAKLQQYVESAGERGIQVLIGLAGGAAALPGAMAAWTTLPIIGVPLPTSDLRGVDSLYAIAQMPPGIPVATVAVGSWGARNAGFLAAQILGLQHETIRESYAEYRRGLQK